MSARRCNCGAPVGFGGVHDVGAKGCKRDIFGQAKGPRAEMVKELTPDAAIEEAREAIEAPEGALYAVANALLRADAAGCMRGIYLAARIEQAAFDRGRIAERARLLGEDPNKTASKAIVADVERLRAATDGIRAMHAAEVDGLRAEIERLKKESAAHWSIARTNGEDAAQLASSLLALRDAAGFLCESEGNAVDDDIVEVDADLLSQLREAVNASRTAAAKDRINDLRRAARSVVQAWQVEPGDRFSADWHAEFRCLESALRAFPNPIIVPKERA